MAPRKRNFGLTIEAENDLRGIWRFTAETWGPAQADEYLARLESCCASLLERPAKSWVVIHADLKSCRCQKHVVFFLRREAGRPIVIAFFHERMDLMVRLKGRL